MLQNIKYFLFLIKCRIKRPILIFYLFIHEIKKLSKIGFKSSDSNFSEIDLVIPTIPKNFETLNKCIEFAKQNLNHKVNKVFIISPETDTIKEFCMNNNFVFINENNVLEYKASDINYMYKNINRSGWIFQQLLKLASNKIVESDNFLVLDSDTLLINRHTLITKDNKFVLLQSSEWHNEYMDTYKKIFKENTTSNLSFISHMMIFNKKILKEFKTEIKQKNNKEWDKTILSFINPKDISYFSEYESYGNWLLKKYPEKIKLVPFYNKSISNFSVYQKNEEFYKKRYNSVSIHKYQS